MSLIPEGSNLLTVEFKTNLLAPSKGERFVFRAEVIKPGRTLTVCEARAYAIDGLTEDLIASMTGTPFTASIVDTSVPGCLAAASCPTRTYTNPSRRNQNFIDVNAF